MLDERYASLGQHQWKIIELLRKNGQMTIRELAVAIYKCGPITDTRYNTQYRSIAQSVKALQKKGLIEGTAQEIRWSLKK